MAGIPGLIRSFCSCLFSIYLLIIVVAATSPRIGRSSFPKGFIFGAGSSAYQVEGAAREGGRGPSIWDTFSHIEAYKIADGKNGDVAVDQYHRYKEDIQLLKYLGMDVYRFSISWPRIFPKGSTRHGGVNEEGIAYYNNLINELLKNGIEPFVTLFHWDIPQVLEDEYGGFLSKKVVEDFGIFADECFRAFGDRVKYWITVNEPLLFSYFGYDTGIYPPGRCSDGFGNCTEGNSATEPYIVSHNILLAHSAAVKIYRTKYQGKQNGSIGIALAVSWIVPFTNSLADRLAAQRELDFRLGWFLDPLTSGKYPDSMRILVGPRLPQFTTEEANELKGSFNFLGYNYYSGDFVIDNPSPPNPVKTDYVLDARTIVSHGVKNFWSVYVDVGVSVQIDGVYLGSSEGVSDFRSYPAGLRDLIIYTKHRYNNPPIYITETGYADYDNGTTPLEVALNDPKRVKYHYEHLSYLLEAMREGADVLGYLVWSLLDDFEWSSGYTYRFGLYYVQYKDNLKRYPRSSAHWFKHILKL